MLRPNYTNLGKKLVCRAASSYSKNTGNNIPNTWQSYKIRPNLKADTKVATDCPKFKEEEKNIAESLRAKVSILDLPIPPFQQLERGENDYIPAEIFNKPLFKGKYQLRFLCSHATLEACKQANHAITVKKFGAILTISEFTNPEGVLTLVCPKENVAECLKKILPDMVYKTKAPLYTLQEEDYCTVHLMFPSENKNTLVGDKSQTNMVALREKLKVNMTNFRLFADECPQSSERVIRIKHAFDDQIIKMITAILPIIMAPVKEPQLLYEPIYHDPRLARTYGGYTEDYDNRYTWQNPNYSSHQATTEAGRLYLHGDAAKKTYFTKLPKAVQQDETLGEDGKEEKF